MNVIVATWLSLVAPPTCARAVEMAHREGAHVASLPSRLAVCVRVWRAARSRDVSPDLAVALAWSESRMVDGVTSRAGAVGPLQVVPRWWCPGRRVEGCDTVDAGARALAALVAQHGPLRGLCHYASGSRCTARARRYAEHVVRLARALGMTAEPGAAFKYPCMPTADLCALNVSEHAADDCALFMWATFPMFADALRVMSGWGFAYSTVAWLWVKTSGHDGLAADVRQAVARDLGVGMPVAREVARVVAGIVPRLHWGMGQSTRANAEPLLIGFRGRLGRVDAGLHQVVMLPVRSHSEKPPEFRDLIVQLVGDRPRLELFARRRAEGWDAHGHEAPGGADVEMVQRQTTLF